MAKGAADHNVDPADERMGTMRKVLSGQRETVGKRKDYSYVLTTVSVKCPKNK